MSNINRIKFAVAAILLYSLLSVSFADYTSAGTWGGSWTASCRGGPPLYRSNWGPETERGTWSADSVETNGALSGTWSAGSGCTGQVSGNQVGDGFTWAISGTGCMGSGRGSVSGKSVSGSFSGGVPGESCSGSFSGSCTGGACTCKMNEVFCDGACCPMGRCLDGICCPSQNICGSACCMDGSCLDGECCPSNQICGTGCCASGQCLNGTCCNQANVCGSACCLAGEKCQNGKCCPSNQINCDGTCIDAKIDSLNCGGCGKKCIGSCVNGSCAAPVCKNLKEACNASKDCCNGANCCNGTCTSRLCFAIPLAYNGGVCNTSSNCYSNNCLDGYCTSLIIENGSLVSPKISALGFTRSGENTSVIKELDRKVSAMFIADSLGWSRRTTENFTTCIRGASCDKSTDCCGADCFEGSCLCGISACSSSGECCDGYCEDGLCKIAPTMSLFTLSKPFKGCAGIVEECLPGEGSCFMLCDVLTALLLISAVGVGLVAWRIFEHPAAGVAATIIPALLGLVTYPLVGIVVGLLAIALLQFIKKDKEKVGEARLS